MALVLFICTTMTLDQRSNGVYKSTVDSFREQYLLEIKGKKIVLIGWELLHAADRDTIYFRAETSAEDAYWAEFREFSFSKTALVLEHSDTFWADTELSVPAFLLYRYIHFAKNDRETVTVHLSKDVYDSRVDEYVFVRVKQLK